MATVSKYHREPETTGDLLDRIEKAEDDGLITPQMATALIIAAYHQCQLDYDALQTAYNEGEEDVQQLLIDLGVIIVLSEEQTRAVKYGV